MGEIEEFVKNALRGKSEQTQRTYVQVLRQFKSWLKHSGGEINQLTHVDVQCYLDYLAAHKRSAATIKKVLAAITAFCSYTRQFSVCENIRTRIEAPSSMAPKAITREEELTMLRQLERQGNKRNLAIFLLLLESGLRVSELCGLDLEDVLIEKYKNGYRGEVIVRSGKGYKQRIVPIPHRASVAILEWMSIRPQMKETAMFLSTRKRRITKRQVQRILERLGTHPHALRHTFCTRLVQSSEVDIVTVAELAGHTDINTTRKYAKPSKERLQEAMEKVFL